MRIECVIRPYSTDFIRISGYGIKIPHILTPETPFRGRRISSGGPERTAQAAARAAYAFIASAIQSVSPGRIAS